MAKEKSAEEIQKERDAASDLNLKVLLDPLYFASAAAGYQKVAQNTSGINPKEAGINIFGNMEDALGLIVEGSEGMHPLVKGSIDYQKMTGEGYQTFVDSLGKVYVTDFLSKYAGAKADKLGLKDSYSGKLISELSDKERSKFVDFALYLSMDRTNQLVSGVFKQKKLENCLEGIVAKAA